MNEKRFSLPVIAFAALGWIAAGAIHVQGAITQIRAETALHSAQTWQMYASLLTTRLMEYDDGTRADTVLLPPISTYGCKLVTSADDGPQRNPCDGYRQYNADTF